MKHLGKSEQGVHPSRVHALIFLFLKCAPVKAINVLFFKQTTTNRKRAVLTFAIKQQCKHNTTFHISLFVVKSSSAYLKGDRRLIFREGTLWGHYLSNMTCRVLNFSQRGIEGAIYPVLRYTASNKHYCKSPHIAPWGYMKISARFGGGLYSAGGYIRAGAMYGSF